MSNTMTSKTTSWFEDESENGASPRPMQYALAATYSVDPSESLMVRLVESVVDLLGPTDGQASLELYTYVNPDALEELFEASATKKSGVEVRFTIENYLVTVRSNHTILVYEPLEPHQEMCGTPTLN